MCWQSLCLSLSVLAVFSVLPPDGEGLVLRRLCGSQLVEALLFVCGERGVFYRASRGASVEQEEKQSHKEEEQEEMRRRQGAIGIVMRQSAPYGPKARVLLENSEEEEKEERLSKRGIVEQCCHYYCNYYDLENYCNT
ncbi:insulin-2 [Amia ocellicauda]|uniref:insulin-2 n=1 Tax=Amia ocellicauda TaxID=2972642 RepID=UPI0034639393